MCQTVAEECKGDGDLLNALAIKDIKTGETKDLAVNGLFYAIGESCLAILSMSLLLLISNRS